MNKLQKQNRNKVIRQLKGSNQHLEEIRPQCIVVSFKIKRKDRH